jgi:hypothetical protein
MHDGGVKWRPCCPFFLLVIPLTWKAIFDTCHVRGCPSPASCSRLVFCTLPKRSRLFGLNSGLAEEKPSESEDARQIRAIESLWLTRSETNHASNLRPHASPKDPSFPPLLAPLFHILSSLHTRSTGARSCCFAPGYFPSLRVVHLLFVIYYFIPDTMMSQNGKSTLFLFMLFLTLFCLVSHVSSQSMQTHPLMHWSSWDQASSCQAFPPLSITPNIKELIRQKNFSHAIIFAIYFLFIHHIYILTRWLLIGSVLNALTYDAMLEVLSHLSVQELGRLGRVSQVYTPLIL